MKALSHETSSLQPEAHCHEMEISWRKKLSFYIKLNLTDTPIYTKVDPSTIFQTGVHLRIVTLVTWVLRSSPEIVLQS